jgi:TetR/AcrR family transcriptional regulator
MDYEETSRHKIIASAIGVFAQYGYEKASTTLIAMKSGLSKGLIFHYFGSKADLYTTTYQEVIEIMVSRLVDKVNFAETDLLLRIREITRLKFELMQVYPEIFEFLHVAFFDQPPELKETMQKINSDMIDMNFGKIYQNIDYSRFRADIDLSLALTTINFTLEKWAEEYVQKHRQDHFDHFDYDDAIHQLDPFLDFFQACFYKEGL